MILTHTKNCNMQATCDAAGHTGRSGGAGPIG